MRRNQEPAPPRRRWLDGAAEPEMRRRRTERRRMSAVIGRPRAIASEPYGLQKRSRRVRRVHDAVRPR
jgi:hypothetical protein